MSHLTREELIELGVSVPGDALVEWTGRQLDATRGREGRLEARGMTPANLTELRRLAATVENARKDSGALQDSGPGAAAVAALIRDEASAFWREAKLMAKTEFGSRPDLLARFRTGVQSGLLLGNLTRELENVVVLLRELSSQLAHLGATEAFVSKGERLIHRLKEAKGNLDMACRSLPTPVAQHCHDKGMMYDLTRRLVRIGRLEFMGDPKQANVFNFSGVRRKSGVSTRPRLKKDKVGGSMPA